jgi:hypothetical protein
MPQRTVGGVTERVNLGYLEQLGNTATIE